MLWHKRKECLGTWTAIDAEDLGSFQRLPVTRGLREINPFDYLVDVLRRIGQPPGRRGPAAYPRAVEATLRGQSATLANA